MTLARPVGALAVLSLSAALATALPTAASADEPGHSLALAGPASAQIGVPAVYQASGTVPADVFLNRYVNVYALPTSVVTACPAEFTNAMQLAYASSAQGGETVANTVQVDGSFSVPIAYTARVAGGFLLCGYLHEGLETMATGFAPVSVPASGGGGGGTTPDPVVQPPSNVEKPKVVKKPGKLKCVRGSWSGAPTSYAYAWKAGDKRVKGATARTLKITKALRRKKVSCRVTARNSAGKATVWSRGFRVR